MATSKTIHCPRVGLLVRKNMVHEQAVKVFTHEAILLAAVHGEDAVRPDPSVKHETLPGADLIPSHEYDRLGRNYGAAADGPPYVEQVFGPRQLGRLREIMGRSPDDLFTDMDLEDDFEDEQPDDEPEQAESAEKPEITVVKLKKADLVERLNVVKEGNPEFDFDETAKVDVLRDRYKGVVMSALAQLGVDFDEDQSVDELDAILQAEMTSAAA